MAHQDASAQEIATEVTARAQGVFLWVHLVVRELLEGLENGDSLFDLQRRLRRVPLDLEEYFMRIFNSIDDFYQRQGAETFLMCVRSRSPPALLGFAALEANDPLVERICYDTTVGWKEISEMETQLRKRINARCPDLVEVHMQGGFAYVVEFIHQTARDFLATSQMMRILEARADPQFNPVIALCGVTLVAHRRMKQYWRSEPGSDLAQRREHELNVLLEYAQDISSNSKHCQPSDVAFLVENGGFEDAQKCWRRLIGVDECSRQFASSERELMASTRSEAVAGFLISAGVDRETPVEDELEALTQIYDRATAERLLRLRPGATHNVKQVSWRDYLWVPRR